ncbi:MAG: LCP family protein [Alicyclobacillaceae bacterium]|nr:LCP family protein [Alicyclobacillaceae bacterium]
MRNRKRMLWIGLAALILAVCGIAGYYGYAVRHFLDAIHRDDLPGEELAQWTGTERVNILLMGVDNRDRDSHPRSDSMILVSVDPQTRSAQMYSIMRDTWYRIPGHGYDKINAAFALGGPSLAVRTVEDFLRIPVHYYVVTDFVGFEKLVDIVGGVDLNVEKEMDYVDDGVYDIHLRPGMQHLDGKHALMYVRFRHDAQSDFARTQRQRQFLLALAQKMKSAGTLAKLPVILREMEPYVQTNMNLNDMIQLAGLMRGVDTSQVQTAQIPRNEDLLSREVDGQSVLIPHVSACRQYVHRMMGLPDAETMLASAAEDVYWELYKDGGPRSTGRQVAAEAPAKPPAPPRTASPAPETAGNGEQGRPGSAGKPASKESSTPGKQEEHQVIPNRPAENGENPKGQPPGTPQKGDSSQEVPSTTGEQPVRSGAKNTLAQPGT